MITIITKLGPMLQHTYTVQTHARASLGSMMSPYLVHDAAMLGVHFLHHGACFYLENWQKKVSVVINRSRAKAKIVC